MVLSQPSASNDVRDGYWKHGSQNFQNYQASPLQTNFQKPSDLNPTFAIFQDQQKSEYTQVPSVQYPTHQVAHTYHTSFQAAPPSAVPLDSGRLNKVQILTNPRIASNLSLGISKTDKYSSITSAATKPVYIGVSLPKTNDNSSSHVAAEPALKVRHRF